MDQISLKNFRKYETLEPLNLNDISIFVGKNNAGKSTVVKALMLTLDNLRSLDWKNVPNEEGLQSKKLPVPYFRFDANGFHNLHIGTFERAKCNFINDQTIVFDLTYSGIKFKFRVTGGTEAGQVTVPVESLVIEFPTGGAYEFNFAQHFVSFHLTQDGFVLNEPLSLVDGEIAKYETALSASNSALEKALRDGDALKAAQIQQEIKRLKTFRNNLARKAPEPQKDEAAYVIFPLYYLHEHIGENVLVQYFKALLRYCGVDRFSIEDNGDMLAGLDKRRNTSGLYKAEMENRRYVMGKKSTVENDIADLEKVLSSINVEYVQAHSATQQLILRVDDGRNDINTMAVNDYFHENITAGSNIDLFVKKWMQEFEIGQGISIVPLEGEGYYVKVLTESGEVHLSDMGMGSIQLVILLLRLATIASRTESTGHKWWVIVEEPEQNIHPMLQSKLSDLFLDFQKSFSATMIIETHSEYLIRRTQLLVSEKSYDDQEDLTMDWPVSVFYFPSDKERQPYDMEYLTTGLFAKKFDNGFFDEAGRLHMEILKRNRKG